MTDCAFFPDDPACQEEEPEMMENQDEGDDKMMSMELTSEMRMANYVYFATSLGSAVWSGL